MHDRFNIYPGASADDDVFMAATPAEEKGLAGLHVDKDARVAAWDELPEGRSPSPITALRIFDYRARRKKLVDAPASALPAGRPAGCLLRWCHGGQSIRREVGAHGVGRRLGM